MAIQIYNSLSRKKELFAPLEPPRITMYTCGVTVYDDCHIGHARSLYIFEVIRRYLAFRGFKVTFVRNITDIDDKIINRANELKIDWQELVGKYIARYYEDLGLLGIGKADCEPRATDNIQPMIEYIKNLIATGFAYATKTGVYFGVRKFGGYGSLSGQGIEQMLTGVRKDADETKEDPLDFALWKSSKQGEPFWDSPWGKGRPGWHIECSVMSQKYLKVDTLDIHAGGRDLIFPHHENELAQSEALTGKPFAKYWIHHGLLAINGQKMSKSLGNFVTIKDFMGKFHQADLLKLFFLSAHYSHPIDYTEEKIHEAKQALERIIRLKEKLDKIPGKSSAGVPQEVESLKTRFIEVMDDDFNMPQGLAVVFELVNCANKHIDEGAYALAARDTLGQMLTILGVTASAQITASAINDEEIAKKIADRQAARVSKDFALSDKIRKDLEAAGVILEDSKGSTTWRRKA